MAAEACTSLILSPVEGCGGRCTEALRLLARLLRVSVEGCQGPAQGGDGSGRCVALLLCSDARASVHGSSLALFVP